MHPIGSTLHLLVVSKCSIQNTQKLCVLLDKGLGIGLFKRIVTAAPATLEPRSSNGRDPAYSREPSGICASKAFSWKDLARSNATSEHPQRGT